MASEPPVTESVSKLSELDHVPDASIKVIAQHVGIESLADDVARALKAQLGANVKLPISGKVFVSVRDSDKKAIIEPVRKLVEAGFQVVSTKGTAAYMRAYGITAEPVNKVKEGRPHCVDMIKSNEISLVFNTTFGAQSIIDSFSIRRSALVYNIAYFTTVAGAEAVVDGILALQRENLDVTPLQEYHPRNG